MSIQSVKAYQVKLLIGKHEGRPAIVYSPSGHSVITLEGMLGTPNHDDSHQ